MASLSNFTDALDDIIDNSQPLSLASSNESNVASMTTNDTSKVDSKVINRPVKGTGQCGNYRSIEEIDEKYRDVFSYPYFNLIQSSVIEDALYSDKSIVVCAPTGSGKTVVFEMAIVQLLMELEDKNYSEDFKIIYMAPVKALCTERLTEWYSKFTKLGLLCIEVTGDTDVDFSLLKPYKIIITTPEKWDVLTRRWRDHRGLVEVVKLFMIDEVHILNDESRGPVLEAVVSRMKTIESSAQAAYRLELLENQLYGTEMTHKTAPSIRFIAVSATVSNPEDVSKWLETDKKPAVYHQFGDECRPVKLRRIVEGYHCPPGSSIFKFDILLNYKLWPIIQKYHCGKPTLIFCNTRKGVILTAETLSKELTINFTEAQRVKLIALCSAIKNKKLQSLIMSGVGCHHAGLLIEERQTIERGFRSRDLPILITTTTLAMGVNLPAHLVIIKNTQQYVNGAYQEYSMSTVLQMIGRAGRPQFDTQATAVIMTRLADKARYQALVGGCEPLQSYLHKRLPENLNSEAALGTVSDVAQCVQWLSSTFLYVRAARDPRKYLNLPQNSPEHMVTKKIEDLCVIAMNGLASAGLITMDETGCIQSTDAGRLMSIYYLDLETMKQFMKIEGTESLERLLLLICESHELSDMYLRVDERRCLNALNRNRTTATIRFPMKGKITTKQMKLNCIIQAVLGCLTISDPSLNQEAMKIMRIAERVCKGLVAYVTNKDQISYRPQYYLAVLNSILLAKCIYTHLWEDSPFVSRQLKGIGPTFSTLLASAGKANFMLLEESHPRDLERIMNKGAPAGNVIRKQISLLPKYQLSFVPIDENRVSIELVLLNQNHLAENIEQLTAGSNHKCYIIVGDSENHILLLTSFNDKDLISVFNGIRTHDVKRVLQNEHKIYAHCISTTFAGIDAHTEYLFNDLNKFGALHEAPVKDTVEKQTYITDTFKHRKRNCPAESEKTHCKEKKRRVNAIMESFNYLKNTFETASKNIQEPYINIEIDDHENLAKTNVNSDINLNDSNLINDKEAQNYTVDCDDFLDDAKIDRMLAEIECEMYNKKAVLNNTSSSNQTNNLEQIYRTPNTPSINCQRDSINNELILHHVTPKTTNKSKRYKTTKARSNYSYVDILEKHMDLDDDDDKTVILSGKGFTETIKYQINKYMQEAEFESKTVDTNVNLLLKDNDKDVSNPNLSTTKYASDDESILSLTQKLDSYFENEEQTKGKAEITGTALELLSGSQNVPTANRSFEIDNILCPNLENNKIEEIHNMISKELLLGHKDKIVTHDNSFSVKRNSPISNDRGNSSVILKPDDHFRTNRTSKDVMVISSIENYTNNAEEVKDRDLPTIVEDKNMYEEKKQISCDINVMKKSNDGQNRSLKLNTEKEIYGSQTLENGLDEIFSITHNYNKCINELQKSIKLQSITSNTREISQSNIFETYLNKNASKANRKFCINENIYTKNQIAIKTNDTRDVDEIKQNIVIPNKFNSIEQDVVEAQKYTVTDMQIQNINLAPRVALSNKMSNEGNSIANVASIALQNISMPLQNSFVVNKSLSQIDISKMDIVSKDSLIHDVNENARVITNNAESIIDQIRVQSNQKELTLSDLITNSDANNVANEISRTNNVDNNSYTATKIELHSKNPPLDRSLHVVQSVEINFNFTQVISAIKCKNEEFTNKYTSKAKYSTINEIQNKAINEIDQQNTTSILSKELLNCNQDMSCIEIQDRNQKMTNYLKDDLLGCEVIKNSINNKPLVESPNPNQDSYNESRTNLSDQKHSEITEMLNQKPDDMNKTKNVENTTEASNTLILKDDVIKSEDNIQNILKKYSNIVRKNAASGQTQIQTASFKNVATNKIPIKRPRQRSRISDLQKLQVTFPENIIECNQTVDETTPTIEQIRFNKIVARIENPVPKNILEEKLNENFNDRDTEQVYKAVDLETDKDYNVDLSLFDPKVLLQSTLDVEDEIIPPPPQFQDDPLNPQIDIEISDNFSTTDNYNPIISYKENEFTEDLSTTDNYRPPQRSEFSYHTGNYNNTLEENFDATNLTPSQEIETWVLPEDDFVDDYSSLNPKNSFAQENSRCSFDLPGSSKLPYKTLLGQYKFNPKNKLRKWK